MGRFPAHAPSPTTAPITAIPAAPARTTSAAVSGPIPPIPMTLRTMAFVFLGISFFSALIGNNDGGNAAHLAGAGLGYFLVKKPGLLSWADRLSAQAIQDGYNQGRYEKKMKQEQASRAEVDRILAKVSEKGLQSLTKREKKILQQDTDRLRDQ